MDKTWVKLNRCSTEYLVGMHNFVQHSLRVAGRDGLIKCPCRLCCNRDSFSPATVKEHLKVDGMDPVYEDMLWVDHGEALPEPVFVDEMEQEYEVQDEPLDMLHMLTDVFATNSPCHSPYVGEDGSHTNVRPSDAERFYNLIEEANISLYPGCTKMGKLEFLVRLYQIKCITGSSDKSLSLNLKLIKSILPDGETLPCSLYQTKKLITGLGLTYQKIDACPNDCILYWKDTANLEYCPSCGESRYLVDTIDDNNQTRKVSAKILRYFPIIPRLQRLYMSRVTSKFMSWHGTERPKDGLMRHPADSPAWKELDRLHPSFARDMRNVRLGLASDGFNPFGQMSLSHSTWPVVIAIYNLPPWLCMKKPYMLLSLIIPGPKAPGNDIDVYLAPLIDELKSLWEVGIETYDVHAKESFTMRAALLWTINDFPAYANLSGWSTKGYKACPNCGDDSSSFRLKHSQKICYMGHRRFLPINHRWRTQRRPFNGKEEHRTAPIPLSVHESLIQLSSLQFKFGKGTNVRSARKKKGTPAAYSGQWKKKSIFYQLPYWKDLLLRHNLDVMHIEKNVCESIVGTLLGIDGKNKDTIKARADLEELNIWPNLHPERRGSKTYLPPTLFTLANPEKTMMCEVLHSVRAPDGHSSNLSNCVQVKEMKLVGMKSHDYHVIMQHLLVIAIRQVLPKQVCMVLLELSSYFRHLYANNQTSEEFSQLKPRIVLTLCQMEKIFPPSFFDVMVHLTVHLAEEAALAGPVHYRSMWPFERYLGDLKDHVRNKSRPEGSIAEGYIAQECLSFCSMYLEDVDTRLTRPGRNADGNFRDFPGGFPIFLNIGHPLKSNGKLVNMDYKEWERLNKYVLLNCPEVKPYLSEFVRNARRRKGKRTLYQCDQASHNNFPAWFKQHVMQLNMVPDNNVHEDLYALARGPNPWCTKHKKFVINGFRFRIHRIDKKKKNQNSGVFVRSTRISYSSRHDNNPNDGIQDYYGIVKDIIELDYENDRKIVLFDCDWVNSEGNSAGLKIDLYGFILVNFNKLLQGGDTLILASQAEQVFYVQDPIEIEWHVANRTKPRDLYDLVEAVHDEPCAPQNMDDASLDVYEEVVRTDVDGIILNEIIPQQRGIFDEEVEHNEEDVADSNLDG